MDRAFAVAFSKEVGPEISVIGIGVHRHETENEGCDFLKGVTFRLCGWIMAVGIFKI